MDNITKKINDLFELRLIPELIEWTGQSIDDRKLLVRLKALQKDIYLLDKSLENIWEIDHSMLLPYWDKINAHLAQFGYSKSAIAKLTYKLSVYEAGEIAIRNEIYPSDQQIRPFYYFKSCDVKMIRSIIYDRRPAVQKWIPHLNWFLFDLLTELIDDIEDELEDRVVFNGNRFLFSIFRKGVDATLKEYSLFLTEIESSLHKHKPIMDARIHGATRKMLKRTKDLLNDYKFYESPNFILADTLSS